MKSYDMAYTKSVFTLTFVSAMTLLNSAAIAHKAEIDEHASLVPIPAYSNSYGQAGGASAYQAADVFLSSLNKEQRSAIVFPLSAEERKGWSNLPAKYVQRSGLKLGDLSDPQIVLLFDFLSASLDTEGYQTVAETLAAEAFLSLDSQASRHLWSPTNYWFAFYGEPSMTERWGWQFGGHHLGINLAIKSGVVNNVSSV